MKALKTYRFTNISFLRNLGDLQFKFWWRILWALRTIRLKSNIFVLSKLNLNPDPKIMPKSNPDPNIIILDPQHCFQAFLILWDDPFEMMKPTIVVRLPRQICILGYSYLSRDFKQSKCFSVLEISHTRTSKGFPIKKILDTDSRRHAFYKYCIAYVGSIEVPCLPCSIVYCTIHWAGVGVWRGARDCPEAQHLGGWRPLRGEVRPRA